MGYEFRAAELLSRLSPPLQGYISVVDDSGALIVTSKPVAMPMRRSDDVLIWDGTRFVGFTLHPKRIRVWAFDHDGNMLLENVALHLPFEYEGAELLGGTTSVVTLGPNDYVMVYGNYAATMETRLARFSLPIPSAQAPKP